MSLVFGPNRRKPRGVMRFEMPYFIGQPSFDDFCGPFKDSKTEFTPELKYHCF